MAGTREIDKLLQGFVDGGLPGCGLIVAQRGKTVYEGYFGHADAEKTKPVTSKSVFRLASMSKLPLYTTAMMLYERGAFLLSDPIYNFFPEWKETKKFVTQPDGSVKAVPTEGPITVRDILSMKCGLPYCNFPVKTGTPTELAISEAMKPLWAKGHFTNREQIAVTAKAPLAFEPGEKWLYGFSSELTAGLIEAVCGKPIDEVFEELLFDPLNMPDTRSHYFGDIRQRMVALGLDNSNENMKRMTVSLDLKHEPGPENEAGWARLFSTARDYTNLMQMLACGGVFAGRRVMGRKTIDLMRANGLNAEQLKGYQDTYNAGYGYGMGVRTLIDKYSGNNNGSLGAFGWTGGFGSWCEADPQEGVSIVYMHNMMPNGELYYHHRVRAAAYGAIE